MQRRGGDGVARETSVHVCVALPNGGNVRYDDRDLQRGGALRIRTTDAVARKAIGESIAFQRNEHMAGERP